MLGEHRAAWCAHPAPGPPRLRGAGLSVLPVPGERPIPHKEAQSTWGPTSSAPSQEPPEQTAAVTTRGAGSYDPEVTVLSIFKPQRKQPTTNVI